MGYRIGIGIICDNELDGYQAQDYYETTFNTPFFFLLLFTYISFFLLFTDLVLTSYLT